MAVGWKEDKKKKATGGLMTPTWRKMRKEPGKPVTSHSSPCECGSFYVRQFLCGWLDFFKNPQDWGEEGGGGICICAIGINRATRLPSGLALWYCLEKLVPIRNEEVICWLPDTNNMLVYLTNFFDNCTEVKLDQTCYFTESQYTDTGPTSSSIGPWKPDTWQGSH